MNYCTFFDRSYLEFGLNLHESLTDNSKSFKLFVIAFDEYTVNFLKSKKLKNTIIINYKRFINKKLYNLKKQRKKNEFFWTCTPFVIEYFLKKFNLKQITYVDADVYFYKDPNIIIKKYKSFSVLITKHNFEKKNKYLEKLSGKFCVQFITFSNNKNSLVALQWWKARCEEWCFDRYEDGKFGDQKYLDQFPKKFKNVKIVLEEGAGLAPWNINKFNLKNNEIYKKNFKKIDLFFYHFHYVRRISSKIYFIGGWPINKGIIHLLYKPYLKKLGQKNSEIKRIISPGNKIFNILYESLRFFKYPKNYLNV